MTSSRREVCDASFGAFPAYASLHPGAASPPPLTSLEWDRAFLAAAQATSDPFVARSALERARRMGRRRARSVRWAVASGPFPLPLRLEAAEGDAWLSFRLAVQEPGVPDELVASWVRSYSERPWGLRGLELFLGHLLDTRPGLSSLLPVDACTAPLLAASPSVPDSTLSSALLLLDPRSSLHRDALEALSVNPAASRATRDAALRRRFRRASPETRALASALSDLVPVLAGGPGLCERDPLSFAPDEFGLLALWALGRIRVTSGRLHAQRTGVLLVLSGDLAASRRWAEFRALCSGDEHGRGLLASLPSTLDGSPAVLQPSRSERFPLPPVALGKGRRGAFDAVAVTLAHSAQLRSARTAAGGLSGQGALSALLARSASLVLGTDASAWEAFDVLVDELDGSVLDAMLAARAVTA